MKTKMPKISIECNLIFHNDTDVDLVKRKIGLTPSSFKNKSEQCKIQFKDDDLETIWSIETKRIDTFDLEDVSKTMVKMLCPYLTKIKQIIIEDKCSVEFIIIPDFYVDNVPGLCFDIEFLNVVHFLNATIKFDMYVSENL